MGDRCDRLLARGAIVCYGISMLAKAVDMKGLLNWRRIGVGITGAGQAPDAFFIWSTIGEAPAGRPNRSHKTNPRRLVGCVCKREARHREA